MVTSKKRNVLDKLVSLNQRVYETMLLKEQFISIYTAGDRKTAQRNLKDWIVKVIMLTNYPYPLYRKRSMRAGADFFFDKSREFQKVRKVLNQLVLESLGAKK